MDRVKNKKRNTARGIIFFENKVVMMHRIKKGREYYVIPGGGIEPGEESIEALKREIKEELSIKVESAFKVQTLFLKKGNQDYYIVKAE